MKNKRKLPLRGRRIYRWMFFSLTLAENILGDGGQKANFLQTPHGSADAVETRELNQMNKSLDQHLFPQTARGKHHTPVYLEMVDYTSAPWIVCTMSAGNPRREEKSFYNAELQKIK